MTARVRIRLLGPWLRLSHGMTSAATTGLLISYASSASRCDPAPPIASYAGHAARSVRASTQRPQRGAARGDLQVRPVGQQALGLQRRDRRAPRPGRPAAREPQRLAVHLLRRDEQDERLEPADPGGQQRRHVPVAAELAQQRLGPPELQVRLVRPVQRGVGREQGPALRVGARLLRGRAGQLRRLGHLRRRDGVTEQPAQAPVGRLDPRGDDVGRRHVGPRLRDRGGHGGRVEGVEGRRDQVRADVAEGGRPLGEVRHQAPLEPEPDEVLLDLGGEVEDVVQRLQCVPGTAAGLGVRGHDGGVDDGQGRHPPHRSHRRYRPVAPRVARALRPPRAPWAHAAHARHAGGPRARPAGRRRALGVRGEVGRHARARRHRRGRDQPPQPHRPRRPRGVPRVRAARPGPPRRPAGRRDRRPLEGRPVVRGARRPDARPRRPPRRPARRPGAGDLHRVRRAAHVRRRPHRPHLAGAPRGSGAPRPLRRRLAALAGLRRPGLPGGRDRRAGPRGRGREAAGLAATTPASAARTG